jgi:hypothetical protein
MKVREIPCVFVVAVELDRTRPSLGAMDAFFSVGVADKATRRVPFVQQISSSVQHPVAKVQTMPAEPLLRPASDTADAPVVARRGPGARVTGRVR